MQRKGISIWEAHLEHFVLGAAVLFFLVFTGLQIISKPNNAELPKKGKVSPRQIDDILEDKSGELRVRLASDAPAELDLPDHPPMLDAFQDLIVAAVSPADQIMASHPPSPLGADIGIGPLLDVVYVEPQIPAPLQPVVEQYFDALASEVVEEQEALQGRFPETPYDLTWMTAAAVFDLKAVREQYERSGENDESAIPVNWYYNTVHVLDVRMEREELVGGTWTNRVSLDPLPGQITLRDRFGETSRDEIIASVSESDMQDQIMRPPFYATRNDVWTAPNPRLAGGEDPTLSEEEKEARRMQARLDRLVAERDKFFDRYTGLGGNMDRDDDGERGRAPRGGDDESKPPSGGTPGAPGAGGGRAGGDRRQGKKRAPPGAGVGGSGLGMSGAGGGESGGKADPKVLANLEERIQRKNRQLRAARRSLDAFLERHGLLLDEPEDVDPDTMEVWVHDISVEPGKTYRYRATVDVYNPFFAHARNLLEQQKGLAESMTLSSESSPWSAPKTAIPPLKVFITKANVTRPTGDLGMGQCTAQVFRFYYGRWWMEDFTLEPGDHVGGEKAVDGRAGADGPKIDYGTDWFVLDIIRDIDADRSDEDRGLGATVSLQSLRDPSVTIIADPRVAADDPDRQQLLESVEEAELPDEFARADAPGAGSGG